MLMAGKGDINLFGTESTLQACISLNAMYNHAREQNQPMPNEGEFRAYHLLLLMGTHGKYKYNSTEYRKALKVPS